MTTSSPWVRPLAADGLPQAPAARLLRQPVQLLRLSGPDTLRFLHGQTSQDLALARPGAWLATCCISPTARMRALAEVLVEEQAALLVITAGDGEAVRQAFDRVLFPADAVELGPLQEGLWLEPVPQELIPIAGESGEPPAAAPGTDPAATVTLQAPGQDDAVDPRAVGSGRWRARPEGGWWLGRALVLPAGISPPADLAALEELESWEIEFRRLRLGLPAAPSELNDDTNPFELGLADRVSLTKGCYVGQETLARLATYDGVRRQLRRWQASPAGPGLAPPLPGSPLRSTAGERAGVISSSLALPDGSGWVGLALVRRAALAEAELWCPEPAGAGPGGELGTDPDQDQAVARDEAITPGAPSPDGLRLLISLPEAFVAPPVGAGGQAR